MRIDDAGKQNSLKTWRYMLLSAKVMYFPILLQLYDLNNLYRYFLRIKYPDAAGLRGEEGDTQAGNKAC